EPAHRLGHAPSVGAATRKPRPPCGVSASPYPSRGWSGVAAAGGTAGAAGVTGLVPAGQAGNRLAGVTLTSHRRPYLPDRKPRSRRKDATMRLRYPAAAPPLAIATSGPTAPARPSGPPA